jgi:hypothetical protein
MARDANSVVEAIENNWVGATVESIESHVGKKRIWISCDGLDDEIIGNFLPDMGWKVVSVSAASGSLKVGILQN